jgi:apolipoprotein D and lipocalin family protein
VIDARGGIVLRNLTFAAIFLALTGCSSSGLPPLAGLDRPVDLQRFMGDWYVLGFIPIDLPFISEKDAHNAVESYALAPDGQILTTYTFRDGSFDGPEKQMKPRGRVANPPLNSEWKMKFFWFLPAGDYLIIDVDPDYTRTIIAVPDRRWVWLMARQPSIPDADYQAMLDVLTRAGFDAGRVQRVPQRWAEPTDAN